MNFCENRDDIENARGRVDSIPKLAAVACTYLRLTWPPEASIPYRRVSFDFAVVAWNVFPGWPPRGPLPHELMQLSIRDPML